MRDVSQKSDRRGFGRRTSNVHASVLVPGRAHVKCIVRNFSADGALLEMAQPLTPPGRFKLQFDSTGEEVDCELRHVNGQNVGVQFASAGMGEIIERALGKREAPRRGSAEGAPDALAGIAELPPPNPPRVSGSDLRKLLFKQAS